MNTNGAGVGKAIAEDSLMIVGLCKTCVAKLVNRNTGIEWLEEEPRFQIM